MSKKELEKKYKKLRNKYEKLAYYNNFTQDRLFLSNKSLEQKRKEIDRLNHRVQSAERIAKQAQVKYVNCKTQMDKMEEKLRSSEFVLQELGINDPILYAKKLKEESLTIGLNERYKTRFRFRVKLNKVELEEYRV